MEKLIAKSLELAGFKNVNDLMTVINATPNPTVATEIILGIHEPTTPEEFGVYWKHRYDDKFMIVKFIDDLQRVVFYEEYAQKKVKMYFPTKEDFENNTNGVISDFRPDVNYDSKWKAINEYTVRETSEKLEDFERNKSVKREDYNNALAVWTTPAVVEEVITLL